jgi:hypothetical protein
MDEARKNFVYNQIISGIKFITIKGIRYTLNPPSRETRVLAEHVYQDVINSLRFDDLMTDEQCERTLMSLSLWSPNDNTSLEKLEKLLEDQKVRLFKKAFNVKDRVNTKKQIAGTKKAINRSLGRKHFLDSITLRFHALMVKNKFLMAMGLKGPDGNHIYDEKSFWNSDSTVLEKAFESLERSIITIEEYRSLARNDPWRSVWGASKEQQVFGTAGVDWTEEQRNLVSFSRMYDGAYQSPDCPDDSVFEDDDMFDGWLIDQRRTREKEQSQNRAEKAGNWKDSAQEVFITAPTREDADSVYELNDLTARMTIQERQQALERGGILEDKDLPDVQRTLMVQAKEQQLNRR